MEFANSESDTFPKLLLHHSAHRGERPAIREKSRGIWRTMTWRGLADEAAALAAALSARGLQRGAHVALLGDNRPRLYAAMAAAQWLGAVAVPLYQDATAEELLAPLRDSEATHIFAENQEQVDKILQILPRCPKIQCIVYDKDRGMRHYRQPQLVTYADFLLEGSQLVASKREMLQAEAERGAGHDTAFLFFTSGTTGPAKGVVFTYASLIASARVAAAMEGLTEADVAMAYLPVGWIGQNLFSCVLPMVVGYCVCCPESSDTMLVDMREVAPTCFLATPRVLESLLAQISIRAQDTGGLNQALYRRAIAVAQRVNARRLAGQSVPAGDRILLALFNSLVYGPIRDLLGMSRLRVAYTAGDAIAPELLMFFRALGINLKQLYGSTETGFLVAVQRDGQIKPGTAGLAIEGVELKFTPQREILVRSPGMFKEYHRNDAKTSQATDTDGWFHTGDAGYLDSDGQLLIIDRLNNVGVLRDGAAFTPRLLENKLKTLSYIKEAIAIGHSRDSVCALVDIDLTAVSRWADRQEISYTGHADLASRDEVYGLIANVIAELNAALARDPVQAKIQIRRFAILSKELDADDGLLTRTGKLRRDVINERYGPVVDAMYDGRPDVRFDAGGEPVELKIRDVNFVAAAYGNRAA